MARPLGDDLAQIERLDQVESTQTYAREAVRTGVCANRGRVFIAMRQTAGVGRFGRQWASPEGGVWMTLVQPLGADSSRIVNGLGLRVGLAVALAIEALLAASGAPARVSMKWPNDVLADGRKLAGVLCETMHHAGTTYALVGVGVNGNYAASDLPRSVQRLATTLRDLAGHDVDLGRLEEELHVRLRRALGTPGLPTDEHEAIVKRLEGVGAPACVRLGDGETREGTLLGLTADGRPRLATVSGEWVAPPGAELTPI